MARRKKKGLEIEDASFTLTSMMDVIFLLLIYFMYLPIQQEADLTVMLPVETPPTDSTSLPNEQVVRIMPNSSVYLNGSEIATPEEVLKNHELKDLASTLRRLKRSSDAAGHATVVTIIPDGDSFHQASMSVLDACAKAGIKQVSFSDAI